MNEVDLVFPDAMQKIIYEKYEMTVLPPEEIVAITVQTLGQAPIYGSRVELSEGENVSWFIHCGKHSATIDFYQPVCVHHLSEMLPTVMNYLCLPTGSKFIIDTYGYEDVWMAE